MRITYEEYTKSKGAFVIIDEKFIKLKPIYFVDIFISHTSSFRGSAAVGGKGLQILNIFIE